MAAIRNINLDIIRGIAAFSVVANHVLSHFEGFQGSIIGNINFSLQNPLFMMVSGFALVYSKPILNREACFNYIKKRTIQLLLPWLIWSLLQFVLFSKESFLEHIAYTANHMEGAYWFLFSIWVMSMIYALSSWLFHKIVGTKLRYIIAVSVSCMFLVSTLTVVSFLTVGIDFLAIKFTAYYFPFYLLGWYVAEAMKIQWSVKSKKLFSAFICFAFISYIILIAKVDMASVPDKYALIRIITSLMGCMVMFQSVFTWEFNPQNSFVRIINWGGVHSLELYVVHYVTMHFLKPSSTSITTINGFLEFLGYFAIVLVCTALIIEVINTNKTSRFILFGKN